MRSTVGAGFGGEREERARFSATIISSSLLLLLDGVGVARPPEDDDEEEVTGCVADDEARRDAKGKTVGDEKNENGEGVAEVVEEEGLGKAIGKGRVGRLPSDKECGSGGRGDDDG